MGAVRFVVSQTCRVTAGAAQFVATGHRRLLCRLEKSDGLFALVVLVLALAMVQIMCDAIDGIAFLLTMWRRP